MKPAKKTSKKTSKKVFKPATKKKAVKTPTKKVIKVIKEKINKTDEVDAFMKTLDHPFKKEVEAVRGIIKGVSPKITEEWKWKAPSFSYKEYMVTFNLWANQQVHLVWHNGAILKNVDGLLEGDYPDRRMTYFKSMAEIKSKKGALEKIIKEWMKKMDES